MTTGSLRKYSILYLFLPNLLFILGWFRPAISMPIAVALSFMFFCELKKNDDSSKLTIKDLFIVFIAAGIYTFFSGIDGLTSETTDWLVHNAKFYDLFKNNWPTYFPETGQYACYYFGYYLVPVFLSKIYGEFLPGLFVVWTFAGYVLALSWVYILLHKRVWALILFSLLRGTGALIFVVLKTFHVTSSRPPNFTPSVRSLFEQGGFAPNQLIPILIATCIVLYDFLNKKRIEESFFMITLLFVWAIFPAATLTLIYIALLFQKHVREKSILKKDRKNLTAILLIPCILLIPTLLYFLSAQAITSNILLWNSTVPGVISGHFTSLMIDLALFYVILSRINKHGSEFPKWLPNLLLLGLGILSFFRIGKYNDLFFRGSIPFCIMLFILMTRALISIHQSRRWPSLYSTYPLLLILAFLAIAGMVQKRKLIRDNKIVNYYLSERPTYKQYSYDTYPNTYLALLKGYKNETEANQYLAKKDSFFERYLCKRNTEPTE